MTKEDFIQNLETLFSFGDTSEVINGCNDLLDWYEKEHNVALNIRFDDFNGDNKNYNEVIQAIRNS